ncbi:MAG: hypothetical protein KDF60_08895 [Calditrichaeota bacterium]|nr:hypothetical protein [Calditrichota bacterium]
MRNKNFQILITVVVVIILVVTLFYVSMPYSIETYAKVKPAKQWLLTRGTDGEIISRLFNFENAINDEYLVNYVSRGDQASFIFNKNIIGQRYINRGDTIGFFNSSETKASYAKLSGELQEAKALLFSMEKGEKQAIIDEAIQKLNFARAKAEKQRLLLSRLDSLYANQLVSEEEFELAKAEMNQLNFEVKISESQLEAVKTGVKPEEKRIVINRVNALQNELNVIEEKLDASVLEAPISGRINKTFSPDTLFNVTNEEQFVLLMPVNLEESYLLKDNMTLELENQTDAEVKELDFLNEVQFLNARQVRIASAVFESKNGGLIPGMIVPCTLKGPDLLLKDHLWKLLK